MIVAADITTFYPICLGRTSLLDATRSGHVRLEGTPADLRALPTWITWYPMAAMVPASVGSRRTTTLRAIASKKPSSKVPAARLARPY